VPTVDYFDTTPNAIPPGDIITLVWKTTGADSVSIDHGVGTVTPQGRYSVIPSSTTVYTLTATNSAGPATAQVTAQVQEPGLTIHYLPSYTTPHVGIQGIVGLQFTILEDASPSTGRKWVVDYLDPAMVSVFSSTYSAYNPSVRGSEGQQAFVFNAIQAGDTRILISNASDSVPSNSFGVYYDVHIQPK
jgi:hypothetical protein